ncbi:MAG TPA: hypothetical protein VG860_03155 [Terriglobia bacterium]|jgi:hypothetical protein|nr:hypothetical protein [Terriglobia bacterium]
MIEYDYNAALQAARQELAGLVQQREGISIRIMQLEKTIAGLATLAAQNQVQQTYQIELSEAILIAMRNAAQPMSPVGIRDMLVAMGFQFSRFVNPMSAVHNALRRLHRKRLIVEYEGGLWGIAVPQT